MFTVVCCNGHRITASKTSIGLTRKCPSCGVAVAIDPAMTYEHDRTPVESIRSLTDTGVMRILLDGHEASVVVPSPPKKEHVIDRDCPRCNRSISQASVVCRHCRCYVGSMPDGMKSLS